MSRLPDPVTENLYVEWPEETDEWATMTKGFFSLVGQAVRKRGDEELNDSDIKEE